MIATDNSISSEINEDIIRGCSLLEGASRDRGIAVIWKALGEEPTKENFLYVLKTLIADSDILASNANKTGARASFGENPKAKTIGFEFSCA